MRDILDVFDQINEATLTPAQIIKYPERFDAFIDHIRDGKPFFTEKEGTEVTLLPTEADRFVALKKQNLFKGGLKGVDAEGNEWPLSSFRKTAEFGGASMKPTDDENTTLNKEGVIVKALSIGITDRPISAAKLHVEIINNPVLQSTIYGRAVIQMATDIVMGEPATIPHDLMADSAVKKAIVDYAGEYLGVLALVSGQSSFPDQEGFLDWLESDISSLVLTFPGKSNNPLSDSFATISNPVNQRQLNISSKGTGGGAAPSVSSLSIPDSVRKKKTYKTAVDLIDLCQNTSLPPPRSISQVFQVMNLLHERVPDDIPKEFKSFLPWPESIVDDVRDSMKNNVPLPKYRKLFANIVSSGEDGGKLVYVTKLAVMKLVNSGSVPEFQSAVLEILDNNFIQQYTTVTNKTGQLNFSTQWPAKLNGVVTLETKSGGTDPTKGGFSFKLKPKGSSINSEPDFEPTAAVRKDKKETTAKIEKVAAGHVSIRPPGTAKPKGKVDREKR